MTSSKPTVGMVSPDAPPHLGGMGRHVGSLLDGLRAAGVRVETFDRSSRPFLYRVARNIGFSFGLGFALNRFARRHGIDILHLHTGPGGALLPFGVPGIPLVVTANHTYLQQSRLPGERWKRIFIPLEKRTYAHADRIVCISEDTARVLTEDYGVDAKKVSVVHCGFDLRPWTLADSPQRETSSFLFVGRPDARKGWDLLRSAWQIVHAEQPAATLHVVGFAGTDQSGIRFHGRLHDKALRTLLGSMSVCVVPSRMEGFGLAAAEAIATGTPVLATDVDGLRCVVRDGKDGLLVPPTVKDIAEGVLKLCDDSALIETLRTGCRNGRNRFDAASEIAAHVAAYDALYSRPCRRF